MLPCYGLGMRTMDLDSRSPRLSPVFDPSAPENAFNNPSDYQFFRGYPDILELEHADYDLLESDARLSMASNEHMDFPATPAYPSCAKVDTLDLSDGEMYTSGSCLSQVVHSGFAPLPRQQIGRSECSICRSVFANRTRLELHAKESDHACFICPYPRCGKSYNRRDVYSRHKKSHQATAGYACRWCPIKPFKRKDHLQQHKRTCPARIAGKLRSNSGKAAVDCQDPSRPRSSFRESRTALAFGYDSSSICNIVRGIGDCLGDDTEGVLRKLLDDVRSQRTPHSATSMR
ncbi:hypothetical protein AC579_9237 [Pseudocercospora musae]|uniref:C2H2-type domain-containing protein n=1 Tax=Pseudocercospora musae TaxID=113226 RepID=A0A139IAU3_9PEZI|nr:hypothetical protein AC579_9237 [Pseudocercospora musae]